MTTSNLTDKNWMRSASGEDIQREFFESVDALTELNLGPADFSHLVKVWVGAIHDELASKERDRAVALKEVQEHELGSRVLKAVGRLEEKNGRGPTAREIRNAVSIQYRDTDEIQAVLEALVGIGLIVPEKCQGSRGPTADRYKVVV